jgi:hypothetical protein
VTVVFYVRDERKVGVLPDDYALFARLQCELMLRTNELLVRLVRKLINDFDTSSRLVVDERVTQCQIE